MPKTKQTKAQADATLNNVRAMEVARRNIASTFACQHFEYADPKDESGRRHYELRLGFEPEADRNGLIFNLGDRKIARPIRQRLDCVPNSPCLYAEEPRRF